MLASPRLVRAAPLPLKPLAVTVPLTCSALCGLFVAMPTPPAARMRNWLFVVENKVGIRAVGPHKGALVIRRGPVAGGESEEGVGGIVQAARNYRVTSRIGIANAAADGGVPGVGPNGIVRPARDGGGPGPGPDQVLGTAANGSRGAVALNHVAEPPPAIVTSDGGRGE